VPEEKSNAHADRADVLMSADGGTPSPRDAAIDWLVLTKEGPLSRKEKAALAARLAADPAHAAAYEDIAQLSADLSALGRPAQQCPRALPGGNANSPPPRPSPPRPCC
jgi:ferric-dicitrate binding protein FerR (iron transport regulator)